MYSCSQETKKIIINKSIHLLIFCQPAQRVAGTYPSYEAEGSVHPGQVYCRVAYKSNHDILLIIIFLSLKGTCAKKRQKSLLPLLLLHLYLHFHTFILISIHCLLKEGFIPPVSVCRWIFVFACHK